MFLGYKPVQHVTVLNTVGNCNTVASIIILYYNINSYGTTVVYAVRRNVLMQRISVILISQNNLYIFRAMKYHHQDVSSRIQAIWYNIMFKYMSVLVNYQCVLYIRWSRYSVVGAILWLGQRDRYWLPVDGTSWSETCKRCSVKWNYIKRAFSWF